LNIYNPQIMDELILERKFLKYKLDKIQKKICDVDDKLSELCVHKSVIHYRTLDGNIHYYECTKCTANISPNNNPNIIETQFI
jgi:hypothetical protein